MISSRVKVNVAASDDRFLEPVFRLSTSTQ